MRLRNKTAIVTGGGSGIGRAIAEVFGREGARVMVADIDAQAGECVGEAIRQHGGDAQFVAADVSREAEVARMMEAAGTVSVLVNNAGILIQGNALTLSDEEWQRCLDIDLKSAWLCAKHAIPRMAEGGSIINIASTQALQPRPDYFPYAVAKGGLLAATVSMAVDFGPRGIRVNAICPGFIETPLSADVLGRLRSQPEQYARVLEAHPLGRLGRPEDVAYAALYLASDEASFVTGTTLFVDGGRGAKAST